MINLRHIRPFICCVLALFFAAAGIAHFMRIDAFAAIVPPALPFKPFIVQLTGVMELVFAAGLVLPRWRARTGFALAAYLLAVLPANIYMALAGIPLGPLDSAAMLWGRVALQFPLIALVMWACGSVQRPKD